MRKLCAIAAVLCAAAAPQSQAADVLGFYGTLSAGAAESETMTFAQASTANLSLDPKTGWALEASLGYHVSDLLRAAVAFGYGMNALRGRFQENVVTIAACGNTPSFPCLSPDVTGDINTLDAFAMGYVDLPLGVVFQPYPGAGVGIVRADVDAHSRGAMNNGTVSQFDLINANSSAMAYRGKVGFTLPIGLTEADVAYAYTVTDKLSLPGRGPNVTFTSTGA